MAMTRDALARLYRKRARRYDLTANLYYAMGFREWAYRKRAVAALSLARGDVVVEIGCGTGLNFSLLERAVGPEGRIIGVDLSDAMLDQARGRVGRKGWRNVTLVNQDAAEYKFPPGLGGVLSTFALTLIPEYDDIIRRGARALLPGKRWVVADLKLSRSPLDRLLPVMMPLFRPFGVTVDLGERRPWESLQRHLRLTRMEDVFFGFAYLAVGEA